MTAPEKKSVEEIAGNLANNCSTADWPYICQACVSEALAAERRAAEELRNRYSALDAAVTDWVNSERGVDLWTVADRSTPEAKVADALAALHVALALDQNEKGATSPSEDAKP